MKDHPALDLYFSEMSVFFLLSISWVDSLSVEQLEGTATTFAYVKYLVLFHYSQRISLKCEEAGQKGITTLGLKHSSRIKIS